MHLAHEIIHAIQLFLAALNHEVDTLAQNIELGICNQDGNLDERIVIDIEPGHLTVDPDQIRGVVLAVFRVTGHGRSLTLA